MHLANWTIGIQFNLHLSAIRDLGVFVDHGMQLRWWRGVANSCNLVKGMV
jgi:hypothetical protein